MSKKIVITGGSGFIGSHVIESAERRGFEVYSIDWNEPTHGIKGFTDIRLDFCDFENLKKTFQEIQPDSVIHLGAVPSVATSIEQPVSSYYSNIDGTYSVLEAARNSGVRRLVFASSAAVYGKTGEEHAGEALHEGLPRKPKNPYGLAKKMGEDMVRMWANDELWKTLDAVSLRFFNVFGPRQRRDSAYATAIERFLYQWEKDEPLTIVSPGTQRRDVVYITDVAEAVVAAVEAAELLKGEAINIGTGNNYSIFEIAEIIGGKGYPRTMLPPRSGDVKEVKADISKAKQVLQWSPKVSFEEGIELLKRELKK